MTGKVADKVALVAGGSAGIGLGIAKRFAAEGARVFITGRRPAELDKAAAAIGGNATALRGDVSDLADLDRIFAQIEAQAGRIALLRAHLDRRSQGARHPHQRVEPRIHRHAGTGSVHD